MNNQKKFDIYDRALVFAVRAAKFINKLPRSTAALEYSKQLIRSSGSIGANIEEADGALSKRDFISKIAISRREARESRHWLRLIQMVEVSTSKDQEREITWLLTESKELMLILSSIINNSRKVIS